MISRTHAKKEVMRLAGTSYFPMRPEAISEMVDCLQLKAKSNEHATLVISEALASSANCPTVADLTKLCLEVGRKAEKYPPPCDQCAAHGGNWRMVHTVFYSRTFGREVETDAMTRCDCARGQLLAVRDEEEKRRNVGL